MKKKNKSGVNRPQSSADREILWQWAFHEDNLFNNRFAAFAAIQAFMGTAVYQVLAPAKDLSTAIPNQPVIWLTLSIGLVTSLLWFYVQLRSRIRLSQIETALFDGDPLYNGKVDNGWLSTTMLMISIPVLTTLTWGGVIIEMLASC